MPDFIQLPPPPASSSGDKLDATVVTVSGTQVKREHDRVAGANPIEVADVRNSGPGASDYGLVVREVGTVFTVPANTVGKTPVAIPVGLMPTTDTQIITGDVAITSILLSNGSNSDIGVWITDLSGAPIIPGTSIPASSMYPISLGGIVASGGVTWYATAHGMYGAISGYQA